MVCEFTRSPCFCEQQEFLWLLFLSNSQLEHFSTRDLHLYCTFRPFCSPTCLYSIQFNTTLLIHKDNLILCISKKKKKREEKKGETRNRHMHRLLKAKWLFYCILGDLCSTLVSLHLLFTPLPTFSFILNLKCI